MKSYTGRTAVITFAVILTTVAVYRNWLRNAALHEACRDNLLRGLA